MNRRRKSVAFTLVELLVAIVLIAVLIAVLIPVLRNARTAALRSKLLAEQTTSAAPAASGFGGIAPTEANGPQPAPVSVLASVQSFDATINLTPRLSVGTDQPESIYEATLRASLIASARPGDAGGQCAIILPLPPQIISLGDLTFTVNGEPTTDVALESDKLIWRGALPETPVPVSVAYTAVGRGMYTLQNPPGKIIDHFRITMTANGSDVRMLELSLQPTSLSQAARKTTYVWDYQNLMFGRPIAVDVLGIAPIDRLGELSWLGPVSVVAFGLLIGLMSRAFESGNFDKWMLLLVLGTFTSAYPLMYFAQQFIPLNAAMIASGALTLTLIAVRLVASVGWRIGWFGMTFPAGLIMALTLAAAVSPQLQGILLTLMTLGLIVLAMTLAPRFRGLSNLNLSSAPQPA